MKKPEFIIEVAKKTGLSTKEVSEVLDAVKQVILAELHGPEAKAKLHGFGTFRIVHIKERTGRDIRTGKKITIPERDAIKFKVVEGF